jgi:FemAB-related protein (PEP-CTERM system-associated)
MALEISELHRNDEKAWDEYVYRHPDSTFYHQIGWRNVVEKTYGHKSIYLVAKEDSKIKGILPLFLMKSRLFGTKLVSVPFGPYGGSCVDDKMTEHQLIEEAKKLTVDHNADYLELRSIFNNIESLPSTSAYVTSILELDKDPKVILMNKLNRNKRKTIYKSFKRDLTARWAERTAEFYEIYSRNMRNLGSPAHSNRFFENILKEFANNSKILIVERSGELLYAAFYLFYKDTVINSWSSTLDEYRKYYPTDFGIWNAIKYSCKAGYKYYDFGRSQQNSSNLEFKRRWGTKIKQLHYQYYLNNISEVPNITTSNAKRQRFAKVWKKLPLSIANMLGPLLRGAFP